MSETNDETGSKLAIVKHNVCRTAVSILIVLVIAEIVLRLFVISPSAAIPDTELGWRYRPHATILHSSEGYARNRLNGLGLNDQELTEDSRKMKVLALGDSFTQALQVSQAANFTSIAEQLAPCIDVLNAGRSGTTGVHYPLIADRLLDETSFDRIVVIFTAGDVNDMADTGFRLIYDETHAEIVGIALKDRPPHRLRVLLDPVFSNSSLAEYLKNRMKVLLQKPTDADAADTSSGLSGIDSSEAKNTFQFVLKSINSRAPTYALFIPEFEYMKNGLSVESERSIVASSIIQSAAEGASIPFSRVDELADSYRLTGRAPNGFANKNIRRGHLNDSGHKVTARALIKLIDAECST